MGFSLCKSMAQDKIHLKNGNIIKGQIIENKPKEYLKIEKKNGDIIKFDMNEIDIIKKDKKSSTSTQMYSVIGISYINVDVKVSGSSATVSKSNSGIQMESYTFFNLSDVFSLGFVSDFIYVDKNYSMISIGLVPRLKQGVFYSSIGLGYSIGMADFKSGFFIRPLLSVDIYEGLKINLGYRYISHSDKSITINRQTVKVESSSGIFDFGMSYEFKL